MSFREKVYSACIALLEEKIGILEKNLRELAEGAANDSKSSAGDKHETSRAMVQLEQGKLGNQLKGLTEQKDTLAKSAGLSSSSDKVIKGSLLKTDKCYLLLNTAFGKVRVEEKEITGLSPDSPLGAKLMGLKTGDSAEINGTTYKIEELLN